MFFSRWQRSNTKTKSEIAACKQESQKLIIMISLSYIKSSQAEVEMSATQKRISIFRVFSWKKNLIIKIQHWTRVVITDVWRCWSAVMLDQTISRCRQYKRRRCETRLVPWERRCLEWRVAAPTLPAMALTQQTQYEMAPRMGGGSGRATKRRPGGSPFQNGAVEAAGGRRRVLRQPRHLWDATARSYPSYTVIALRECSRLRFALLCRCIRRNKYVTKKQDALTDVWISINERRLSTGESLLCVRFHFVGSNNT